MTDQINLYHRENELIDTHAPKVFKSSPTLDMMVAKGEQYLQDYASALRDREALKHNCRVGKNPSDTWGGLPALQVRAIYKKEYVLRSFLNRQGVFSRDEVRELVGWEGNECTGSCEVAGQRSRKEWCKHGNLIND